MEQPQIDDRVRPSLGRANYFAMQFRHTVRIWAFGVNPTGGWSNFFEKAPISIWPPQFLFYSIRPDGPSTDVLTPFLVETEFAAFEPVDSVTVWDAAGAHRVPVANVSMFATADAKGGDGPFPRQELVAGWSSGG
jgi:hypothetical protein